MNDSQAIGAELQESEFCLRRTDGQYLTAQGHACVIHDTTGLPVRIVAAMHAITSSLVMVEP